MKVCIAYPPLESKKGIPLLSQNRQFQWSKSRTIVYPVIPASAATLLKTYGYDVCWLDGTAENWTYERWLSELMAQAPDLIFIETKTPVIKRHWRIAMQLKKKLPRAMIVFAGDHVTALPQETFKNSPADYVLLGGYYDFLLLDLADHLVHKKQLHGNIVSANDTKLSPLVPKKYDLNTLPLIDRKLTKWRMYSRNNGNYKYVPGAYIMAGRDCWWRKNGGCTFCSWTSIFPAFSYRSVENVLDEVGALIHLGVKEIFDDTGTFLTGTWLKQFCEGMIERGYSRQVVFGCNMRFGYLSHEDYSLMARAGFRFILYGLESASQQTIDRIRKGTEIEKIERELKDIADVNRRFSGHIEPHVTCMVGYPWETKADAQKTIKLCQKLFKKGLIRSLQATIVIPYPGNRVVCRIRK